MLPNGRCRQAAPGHTVTRSTPTMELPLVNGHTVTVPQWRCLVRPDRVTV